MSNNTTVNNTHEQDILTLRSLSTAYKLLSIRHRVRYTPITGKYWLDNKPQPCPCNDVGERAVDIPHNDVGERAVDIPRNDVGERAVDIPRNDVGERAVDIPRNDVGERAVDIPRNDVGERAVDIPRNDVGDVMGCRGCNLLFSHIL